MKTKYTISFFRNQLIIPNRRFSLFFKNLDEAILFANEYMADLDSYYHIEEHETIF